MDISIIIPVYFNEASVMLKLEKGGAIVCHDEKTKKRIDILKNFGFADEVTVVAPGINAKMNEFQAALGVLQLKYIDREIEKRKEVANKYREGLEGITGINFLSDIQNVKHNYQYFPILIDRQAYGKSRDEVYESLKLQNIYTRRYFYPLFSTFPTYRGLPSATAINLPAAEKISKEILCFTYVW